MFNHCDIIGLKNLLNSVKNNAK